MTTATPVNGPMMGFNAYPTGTELKICCNEYRRNESNYAERKLTMSTVAIPQTTTTWNIDPVHSVAEFKVKHMMISNVKGQICHRKRDLISGRGRSNPFARRGFARCCLSQHTRSTA